MTLRQYWYRSIYLRSPAWRKTRERILDRDDWKCAVCQDNFGLQVHHRNYRGTPKMRWYHFLPFARFFIWKVDTNSDMITLCRKHHEAQHKKDPQ